jgi:heme oxygenase
VSPIHQQLKRETARLHRRLETDLGLLDAHLCLDGYRRILELFFGFYSPIEAGTANLMSTGLAFEFPCGPAQDSSRAISAQSACLVAKLPACLTPLICRDCHRARSWPAAST